MVYLKLVKLNLKKIVNLPIVRRLVPRRSKKELHEYWKHPTDAGNEPRAYLKGQKILTDALLTVMECYGNKTDKILEIGCNVGRNLNSLYKEGFKNLNGIEINQEAIKIMRDYYPEMYSASTIFESSVEDKIKEFQDDEFDVIFTMAVLMHIHKNSEWIFSEIVRITKKYLVIIEDEKGVARKNFPRNYKKIFESFGMRELEMFNIKDGYLVRVFGSKLIK